VCDAYATFPSNSHSRRVSEHVHERTDQPSARSAAATTIQVRCRDRKTRVGARPSPPVPGARARRTDPWFAEAVRGHSWGAQVWPPQRAGCPCCPRCWSWCRQHA